MDQVWEITCIDSNVVDAPAGLTVLEWNLNRTPELEWIKYFISGPGNKSGTMDFISRAPEVVGNKVRFTVREEDLENAVRRIQSSIEGANQMFDTYVMSRRRKEKAERQAEQAVKERRLMEARERLDRLTRSQDRDNPSSPIS